MTPKEKVVFETKEEKKISEVLPVAVGADNAVSVKVAASDEAAKRDGAGDGAGKAADPVEAEGEADPKPTILDEITSQNGTGNGAGRAADTVEGGAAVKPKATILDEIAKRDAETAAEDGAEKLDKKTSGYTDRDILEIILENKDDEKEEVPDGIVKLSKPVSFDGQIIETIDLRELQNISQKKAKKIRKVYNKIAENFTVSPESTEEYAMAAASVITKLPVELFEQLPHKDIVKIRTRVINFFFLD